MRIPPLCVPHRPLRPQHVLNKLQPVEVRVSTASQRLGGLGMWRLTLDVHNLFDKTYYTASWGGLTVIPGLGRQVVAGVQVAF